eukprot:CCRYP_000340-RB/>CCRYP_000340-RB protein AED:0.49 eAED:0.53 QI:0/0/0/1/0/0/2/0/59
MVLGHAFDDTKTSIAKDVVLANPDYSKEFETYTDASPLNNLDQLSPRVIGHLHSSAGSC